MRLVFTILLFLSLCAHAEIYKSVDDEGNTVYTDTPDEQAEEFVPPSMNAIPMPKPIPKAETTPTENPVAQGYQRFSIISPTAEQVIRDNNGKITLRLRSEPKLITGHYFVVFIDGHLVVKKSNQTNITIPDISRGEHQLTAAIRNSAGKTLKRSNSITIHMKRQSTRSGQNLRIGPFGPDGRPIKPGPSQVIFKPGPVQIIPTNPS